MCQHKTIGDEKRLVFECRALQDLYKVPAGLPIRLFQSMAAHRKKTFCKDIKPIGSSARRMSVEVLSLTLVMYDWISFNIWRHLDWSWLPVTSKY